MPLNKSERKMKKNMEDTYGKRRGEAMFLSLELQNKTSSDKNKEKSSKSGYAKGGLVANCGASMKPNGKAKK